MPGRSGFFKQFAEGAIGQLAKDNESDKKKQDVIDEYRAKKLEDLNTEDQVKKREFERKDESDKAKAKLAQQRAAEEMQGFMNSSGSGAPKSPFEMGQFHTARAAALKTAGLDDESAAAKLSADFYQQDIANSDRIRTQAKSGYTSVEGVNPAAELLKGDSAVFTKGEINSDMYAKYRGVEKQINFALKDDQAAIEELKKDSALAARVTQGLTQITADENGISPLSSGELQQDAIQLVQYKNILENPALADQHQAALEGTKQLLEQHYPEPEKIYTGMGFDTLEEKLQSKNKSAGIGIKPAAEAAPVTLSTDAPQGTVSTTKPATQDLITVNSKAAYQQLPSGAEFYTPDGKKRRKP